MSVFLLLSRKVNWWRTWAICHLPRMSLSGFLLLSKKVNWWRTWAIATCMGRYVNVIIL